MMHIIDQVSIDYVFQEKFQDNFRLVDTSCTSTNALGYADLNCNILQQFIDLDDISNLNQLNHQLNVDIKYATLILQKPGSVNASHYDKFWPLNDIPTNININPDISSIVNDSLNTKYPRINVTIGYRDVNNVAIATFLSLLTAYKYP